VNAFAAHFAFEFKTGLRNSTLMMMNYLFPLGFYALMGLVMTQINPGFKAVLLPAMVVFTAMASALLGMPAPLVEAREAGIFRSFKINGVPALSVVGIPTLTTAIHALLASAIIAVTAGSFFDAAVPTNWGAFVVLTLLAVAVFGSLGALIGVVAASSRATVLWSQLIFLPSMLLGGLMLPIALLPASIQPVAALLPSTYLMQAFEGLAYGRPTLFNPVTSALVSLAAAVVAFSLAVYLFNWDSRNQTRRGHPLMALLVLVPYLIGILLN